MPCKFTCPNGHTWDVEEAAAGVCPQCAAPGTRSREGMPFTRRTGIEVEAHVTQVHDRSGSKVDNAPPAFQVPGYEILTEIGRGGMGVVWRARHLAFDRQVAIKCLQEKFGPNTLTARRFMEEARITGQLQHPGIPAAYDVGMLPDGRPYFAMKLIKGRTLTELIAERPPGVNFQAVFEAVCQAVGYAHAHHVIHRDLKPSNVMVGAFGEVQVMDWGLGKLIRNAELGTRNESTPTVETEIRTHRENDADYTDAGDLLGTPAYMAPEQALGEIERIDQRTDVFALGAILCIILTGKPPYEGSSAKAILVAAARGKLDDARTRLDACGAEPEWIALAKRCLSFEPADRPADGNSVADQVAKLRSAAEERARAAEMDNARREVQASEELKQRQIELALAEERARSAELERAKVEVQAADQLKQRQVELALAEERARSAELERAKVEVQIAEQRKRRRAQLMMAGIIGLVLVGGATGIYVKYRDATEALGQRDMALGKRDEAIGKRDEAIKAADAREKDLKYQLGINDMLLATGAYKNRDVKLARERLQRVPPEQRRFDWHYLARQTGGGIFTLQGHKFAVTSIVFSPDGDRLATGSFDNTARVWDARSGAMLIEFNGHTHLVTSVAFSPDGTRVVSGSHDQTAKVWNSRTGTLLFALKGHKDTVSAVAFSADGNRIATGSADKTTRVWDAWKGNAISELMGHVDDVTCVAFSPDGDPRPAHINLG